MVEPHVTSSSTTSFHRIFLSLALATIWWMDVSWDVFFHLNWAKQLEHHLWNCSFQGVEAAQRDGWGFLMSPQPKQSPWSCQPGRTPQGNLSPKAQDTEGIRTQCKHTPVYEWHRTRCLTPCSRPKTYSIWLWRFKISPSAAFVWFYWERLLKWQNRIFVHMK